MTAFIHRRIFIGPDMPIYIDGNSKITAGNGTYDEPAPNAFSLPAASVDGPEMCPGSTAVCRATCYVKGLAKNASNVYAAYHANAATLALVLESSAYRFEFTAASLGAWISENARHGFRWHVSGDVWNDDHAAWIARVCRASPDVMHWIYTKTMRAVRLLVMAENLTVNVSADHENYREALDVATRYGARVCYESIAVGDVPGDLPASAVIFPDYPARGREMAEPTEHPWWQSLNHKRRLQVCPADFFGQSNAHRCGPCTKCLARPSCV